MNDRYAEVDRYLEDRFADTDPTFDATLDAGLGRAEEAGLPAIAVSPALGRLLEVLVLATGARRVLELGTLGGYSTTWLARALPDDGAVVTVEVDPAHAEVARTNLAEAGVADRVEVRVGSALEVLTGLRAADVAPFDLVFIDADKPPYADYLDAAIELSRPGTLIVADNVVRDGVVADGPSDAAAVTGVQRFLDNAATDDRLTSAFVQQVGVKGHDGMAFIVVRRPGPRVGC